MPRSSETPDWVLARRMQIGDHIRDARVYANLTQEEVANMIPMDRASYVRIERGQASATIDTLILIADAIGVPLVTFVG